MELKKAMGFTVTIPLAQLRGYYPNGKLYITGNFTTTGLLIVNQCRDSLGNVLATDGKGRCIEYDNYFLKITDQGNIDNGIKIGLWNHYLNNKVVYALRYIKGIARSGVGYDSDGEEHPFSKLYENPVYTDGLNNLYNFIYNKTDIADFVRRKK